MTLQCLESSLLTDVPEDDVEYVIVETESDYFKDYADIHIYEAERSTATKSINRAFRVSSGDHVVLLTNDVLLK